MRTGLALSIFATVGALALVSGCSAQAGDGMNPSGPVGGSDPSDPSNPQQQPLPDGPKDPVANYAGAYELKSSMDLTTGGVLPGVTGPIVNSLTNLQNCPGATILQLAEVASPGLLPSGTFGTFNNTTVGSCPGCSGTILQCAARNVLVGALTTVVQNYGYNGHPAIQQIATIVDGIAEMFKQIDIYETLKVGAPDASMGADVEQQVTKVAIKVFGTQVPATLSAGAMPAAYSKTRGSISAINAPVADANFSFQAAQSLQIPIGEIAYTAAAPTLFAPFGATDLTGALKNVIDCPNLGSNLGNQVSGNVVVSAVVGSVAQVVCDLALAMLASTVEGAIKQVTIEASQGDNVAGKMFDASITRPQLDYTSDRMELDVTWKIGAGAVPAKLSGERKAQ